MTTTHANGYFPPPTSRSRSSATAQVPLLGLFVLVDLGSPKLCKMKNKETEVGRKLASHIYKESCHCYEKVLKMKLESRGGNSMVCHLPGKKPEIAVI